MGVGVILDGRGIVHVSLVLMGEHPVLVHGLVRRLGFLEVVVAHDGSGHGRVDPPQFGEEVVFSRVFSHLRGHIVLLHLVGQLRVLRFFGVVLRFGFVGGVDLQKKRTIQKLNHITTVTPFKIHLNAIITSETAPEVNQMKCIQVKFIISTKST